jgi:hypothetical protein
VVTASAVEVGTNPKDRNLGTVWALLIVGAVGAWALLFVMWVGPRDVLAKIFATDSVSSSQLAALGDSFGLVTALFSGLAVYLVYLTYAAQRDELGHIKQQFEVDRRRQASAGLVDRLDKQLAIVESGNRLGRDLLDWMNDQLDAPIVGFIAADNRTPTQRWEDILDSVHLPSVEPLQLIVNTLSAVAEVTSRAADEQEKKDIASLARSVLRREDVLPLLYSCAVLCRSDSVALNRLSSLLASVGLRPKVISRLPLDAVPISDVNTLDDTHFVGG